MKQKIDSVYIMQFLLDSFPDILPPNQVSEFELGRLIGQQDVIKSLKAKLKSELSDEELITK